MEVIILLSTGLDKINELRTIRNEYSARSYNQSPKLTYPLDSCEFSTQRQEEMPQNRVLTMIKAFFVKENKENSLPEPIVINYTPNAKAIRSIPAVNRYVDWDNARILKNLNPVTLKKKELPKDKPLLEVSNFVYPSGSVMATTSLDDCIATGKLLQCAGVAIVDKTKNQQTLLHCYPGNSQEDVEALLKHVTDNAGKELDITIITGTDDSCEDTISCLVDTLKKLSPKNKIKFANFSKDVRIFNRAVVLENGKLSCCTNDELENNTAKITNPLGKISYIKAPYNS